MSALVEGNPRLRWFVAAAIGLGILVVFGTFIHSHARDIGTHADTVPVASTAASVDSRLAELESEYSSLRHRPVPVSADRFDREHTTLQDHITHLDELVQAKASKEDLAELESRVATIEQTQTRITQGSQQWHSRRRSQTSPATPVAPPDPPFHIVGVELRGGELFLAVTPDTSDTLTDVLLLRAGDTLEGWRLEVLDKQSATFRVSGHAQRLELP